MIKFLIKGLLRDRSRSLIPIIIVSLSVAIVVMAHAYIEGAMGDIVEVNAHFEAGHVKIMTKAYQEEQSLNPNDLALLGISNLQKVLKDTYPDYSWQPRIKFSGLLDFPDQNGDTMAQGTVIGIAADLTSPSSPELENLNLKTSLMKGRLPQNKGEIIVSDRFFESLGLKLNQKGTLIGSGMDGGTAVANLKIVGTVTFGIGSMDRGAIIADITDIQQALYMDDAASEILGIRSGGFDKASAEKLKQSFNQKHASGDEFSPIMTSIVDLPGLSQYVELGEYMGTIMVVIFVWIVTIVLWNSGVRNGIRRYSEFGLRIAIGEERQHVYLSQLVEALVIGVTGSVIGTCLGLIPAYYLQEVGFNISGMIDASMSTVMMQDIIRAKIQPTTLWIGFIPGIFSTLAGALIAGLGIFRRNTAQLFKELEV